MLPPYYPQEFRKTSKHKSENIWLLSISQLHNETTHIYDTKNNVFEVTFLK